MYYIIILLLWKSYDLKLNYSIFKKNSKNLLISILNKKFNFKNELIKIELKD